MMYNCCTRRIYNRLPSPSLPMEQRERETDWSLNNRAVLISTSTVHLIELLHHHIFFCGLLFFLVSFVVTCLFSLCLMPSSNRSPCCPSSPCTLHLCPAHRAAIASSSTASSASLSML
eukprot:m.1755 g.1755  ORF g.1755 m.1755 type:complete len:118 (-) comp1117_c0_seq1:41-394(-)